MQVNGTQYKVPHRHGHLIFDKVAKVIAWGKIFSSTNAAGAIGYPDRKKIQITASTSNSCRTQTLTQNGIET